MSPAGRPDPPAAQVFVYYRVRAADLLAVVAAVQVLHARLPTLMPGLACSLSRRADAPADLQTLMESYAHADGVGPAWRLEIEQHASDLLSTWIAGERHVEVFVPCA
ncbi:MAG: DUF4936 family protein [Pseudomonadota bacterium]